MKILGNSRKQPMVFVITAGPTIENIDPVRFISNRSTGTMGYKIALEAKKRGHKIILITGPTQQKPPLGMQAKSVETTKEMFCAVKKVFDKTDCLIMSAAVCDFKPKKIKTKKITKTNRLNLALYKTQDILQWAGKRKKGKIIIGFCLETNDLLKRAKAKLVSKKADVIVANKSVQASFGDKKTQVYFVDKESVKKLPQTSKAKVAEILLDKIEAMWYK